MDLNERYYAEPLSAFVRTRLHDHTLHNAHLLDAARAAGLRIGKFKRSLVLPRVKKVLGLLRAFNPLDFMDIGSGRGAFLWPLLDAFPKLSVHSIESSEQRFSDLAAISAGGLSRLRPHLMDVCGLDFNDDAVDGVSFLEVLEHLEDPRAAAREVVRVARRFIVLSVPSKPDDNPEHIHFFLPDELEDIFLSAGARSIRVEHVLNHRIGVIQV